MVGNKLDVAVFLSTPSARRATRQLLQTSSVFHYFYPRPLRGGRQDSPDVGGWVLIFLSTPSARRATRFILLWQDSKKISIHALCEEGDSSQESCFTAQTYFYPRPLRGGRPTLLAFLNVCKRRFLSTPSARRATRFIHPGAGVRNNFYPRPLRGGRRAERGEGLYIEDFYPRPLRGGRPIPAGCSPLP